MIRAINALGVVLALGLAASSGVRLAADTPPATVPEAQLHIEYVTLADGRRALIDTTGVAIPVADYERIASGSTLVDAMLLELVEPTRIVSFTQYSQQNPAWAHRFAGKPSLAAVDDLEALLALKPDLLLLNTHGSLARLTRLRDAGVQVFSLGEMRGQTTFLNNVKTMARLLNVPERGERYARAFSERIKRVAFDVPKEGRPRSVYLAIYSKQIYSSGKGTSYHDVMEAAGLHDLGAEHFSGWPELTPAKLLEMDPDLIVTRDQMRAVICAHAGLSELRVCAEPERKIIEIFGPLLSDPGPGMLPAAEALYEAVYGRTPVSQ